MRLIDADNLKDTFVEPRIYNTEKGFWCYTGNEIKNAPTVNAIVIPEGATNGDVMKLIFPDATVEESSGIHYGLIFPPTIYFIFDKGGENEHTFEFGSIWWNEKYFKGNEEPKPMTRKEMIKALDDYCESRYSCDMDDESSNSTSSCPLQELHFCDNTTVFWKWKDEELKLAIEKIKSHL